MMIRRDDIQDRAKIASIVVDIVASVSDVGEIVAGVVPFASIASALVSRLREISDMHAQADLLISALEPFSREAELKQGFERVIRKNLSPIETEEFCTAYGSVVMAMRSLQEVLFKERTLCELFVDFFWQCLFISQLQQRIDQALYTIVESMVTMYRVSGKALLSEGEKLDGVIHQVFDKQLLKKMEQSRAETVEKLKERIRTKENLKGTGKGAALQASVSQAREGYSGHAHFVTNQPRREDHAVAIPFSKTFDDAAISASLESFPQDYYDDESESSGEQVLVGGEYRDVIEGPRGGKKIITSGGNERYINIDEYETASEDEDSY